MKTRSELRDIIIKILYQVYIYEKEKINFNLENLINEFLDTKNDFVIVATKEIILHQKDISVMANKYLKNWDIDRLSKVDKAILSLGIYELMYTDTPKIVSINEAIELAKRYSDENVVKMINATLDQIYHSEEENE